MKIAHVTPFDPFSTFGGQERTISDLMGWQKRKGHTTQVFSLSSDESKRWAKFGHLPAIGLLKRKLPDFSGFDIVHAHGWASEAVFSKKTKTPVLATVYGTIAQYMQNVSLPPWRRAYLTFTQLRFEKNACARADAVASLCQKQSEEITRHYGFHDARPINCGVDTKLFLPKAKEKSKARLGFGKHEKIVLACGRMGVAHKGFDILLQIAKKMGAGETLVVNGKIPQSLMPMMLPNMVARTTPLSDMPFLYSAADLFVHPSRYEGFGLVTAEAMACGTPVVAFDTGAASELIGRNEAGALVSDVRDSQDFIRAALELLDDHALSVRLGRQAQKRASRFTAESMAQNYYDYYWWIISGSCQCKKKF